MMPFRKAVVTCNEFNEDSKLPSCETRMKPCLEIVPVPIRDTVFDVMLARYENSLRIIPTISYGYSKRIEMPSLGGLSVAAAVFCHFSGHSLEVNDGRHVTLR